MSNSSSGGECGIAQDLPADILIEVFVQALFPPLLKDNEAQIQQTMGLSQICSHWRSVILETSEVWKYVECRVTYDLSGYTHVAQQGEDTFNFLAGPARISNIRLLRWWLYNLGSRPPHVEITAIHNSTVEGAHSGRLGAGEDHGPFLLQLLASALSLKVDRPFLRDMEVWLGTFSLPKLEGISIKTPHPSLPKHDALLQVRLSIRLVPFTNMDSLRSVAVEPFAMFPSPGSNLHIKDQLPWAILTHLNIEPMGVTADEWGQLIRECIALQRARFGLTFNSNPRTLRGWGRDQAEVQLPHLTHLVLSWGINPKSLEWINPLQNLKLPSLVSFLLVPPSLTICGLYDILYSMHDIKELRIFSFTEFPKPNEDHDESLWTFAPCVEVLAFGCYIKRSNLRTRLQEWTKRLLHSNWLLGACIGRCFKRFEITCVDGRRETRKALEEIFRLYMEDLDELEELKFEYLVSDRLTIDIFENVQVPYWPHERVPESFQFLIDR